MAHSMYSAVQRRDGDTVHGDGCEGQLHMSMIPFLLHLVGASPNSVTGAWCHLLNTCKSATTAKEFVCVTEGLCFAPWLADVLFLFFPLTT